MSRIRRLQRAAPRAGRPLASAGRRYPPPTMLARLLLASLLLACTAPERPPATEAKAAAAAEAPAPAPEAKAAPKAADPAPAPAATPPAPSPGEPAVSWWCACYYKYSEEGPQPLTACRASQRDCETLEKGVMAGKAGIVARSVTHSCQESRAAHPGDLYGGRAAWQPSKKAGSWLGIGACLLPGQGKEVDLEARPRAAEEILADERLGALKMGLSATEVLASLGEPKERGSDEEWEADGAFHQEWRWPALGLTLDMLSHKRRELKKIASIKVEEPSTLQTAKGIAVGSPRAEVLRHYGKLRDPEFPVDEQKQLIAGSIYGGLMFDFKGGKVSSIFLGAAAE